MLEDATEPSRTRARCDRGPADPLPDTHETSRCERRLRALPLWGEAHRFPTRLIRRLHNSPPLRPLVMITIPEPRAGANWLKQRKPELLAPLWWTMSPAAVALIDQPRPQ